MKRIRSIALPITLSLLVTGCYTQLRAPHVESYDPYDSYADHEEVIPSPDPVYVPPHRHVPVPVFHHPRYDHHDWWLYGDTHCDIWVNRYYDYHPWLPRHSTTIIIGRHHRPRHRHGPHVWYRPPVKVRPRWRHRGPRFEPLSPTIEVEVEVVDRRRRFRRAGFAGGVPERADDLVTTMTGSGGVGAESEVIRVRRPKFDKGLTNRGRDRHGDRMATRTTEDAVTRGWSLPGKTRTPSSPEKQVQKPDRWSDPGRDVKGWGPASQVSETAARQPKPQTNWFNPEAVAARDDTDGTRDPAVEAKQNPVKKENTWSSPLNKTKTATRRSDPEKTSGETPSETFRRLTGDSWSPKTAKVPSEVTRVRDDETTRSWSPPSKVEEPRIVTRDRATEPTRSWSTPKQVERPRRVTRDRDPEPTRSWTAPKKVEKRVEPKSRSRTTPKKVERRTESPTRTWTAPKKVEKPTRTRKVTSRPAERPKQQVKKSSPSKQRSVKKKDDEKKEEKNSSQNRNKQDRSKKRKKSGRRGM